MPLVPCNAVAHAAHVPIYEMTPSSLRPVPRSTFAALGVRERDDLQRLLRAQIDVIAPDVLVVAEEFGDFEGARRRIDLLGLDRDGRLVVIELKRTDDGGHMELQALRYAAMVSAMTLDQVVEQRRKFAAATGLQDGDTEQVVTDWLAGETALSDDVRIILVAADFSTEVTTSVLWLTTRHDLDVMCYRVVPHQFDGRTLLDVQQVIPLPEAQDYQIRLREKGEQARRDAIGSRDYTRYHLIVDSSETSPLSKQQAVKQAVALLVERGVALDVVREAVGNRWRSVVAADRESVTAAYRTAYPTGTHVWVDEPYQDPSEPERWWIMVRVGGPETEEVLTRLSALRPDVLTWRRATSD